MIGQLDQPYVDKFVQDHIREFPLHYGCMNGGWPDDKELKIDLISTTTNSVLVNIWFNEIISKACSCIGDSDENFLSKVSFRITFKEDNSYLIKYED